MIAIYLGILLAWTLVCVLAGMLLKDYLQRREDLNERDAWAERYQQEHKQKEQAA